MFYVILLFLYDIFVYMEMCLRGSNGRLVNAARCAVLFLNNVYIETSISYFGIKLCEIRTVLLS